ncbi:NAD(P)-dependent oxidoreductase [Actinokineospora xionganensis]|uniref:D-3-phosphoglycerate dehydrogenase n=1 Tax=Actinokineospora xionganensis TaxID=2684470 RepID=A0ABR7L4U1_9PSEU|nr:NAD(P)-dependent oxidoreductase [Actinokineospora xionganensis]MBC6447411.1 hypothetical protein [Actinokineospora xionganensis]
MTGHRVYVGADRVLDELFDEIARGLADRGHDVVRDIDLAAEDGALHVLVVTSRTPVTVEFMDRHPELRGVVFVSSGVNSIDVAEASRRGVLVANGATPENHGSMAEATIMLALALSFRLSDRMTAVAELRPRPRPAELDSRPLRGATIGLLGFGRISREVCKRLAAWDVGRILCHTRTPREWPGVEFCSFDTVVEESDILSVHLPLTPATRGLIGAAELARMRPGAMLINTSRGGIIDEDALAEALARGDIGGAAIDTFDIEPLPAASPLRQAPNIMLTDHVIGHTVDMYRSLVPAAIENVDCVVRGETPPYLVNPEARHHATAGKQR